MMDCEPITEYFGLVYDGEADALVEKLVKDHLRSCSACREDYKWYGATIQGMANLEQIAPPNDFLIQLNARIDKNSSPLKSIISQIKNLLNSIPTAPVPVGAASLAFVTIMAIYVYNYTPVETANQSLQTAAVSKSAPSAPPVQSQMVASAPFSTQAAPYSHSFAPYVTPGRSSTAVSWRFPTVADELGADNLTVESPHIDLALQTLKKILPDIQGKLVDEKFKGVRGETLVGVIIPSNRYGDLATALVNHGAIEVGAQSQESPAPTKVDSGNVRLFIRFTEAPK
jgi:hypothetical protein